MIFPLLFTLLAFQQSLAGPGIEDNMLPMDDDSVEQSVSVNPQGQPEILIPLRLPTDEDGLKRLNALKQLSILLSHHGVSSFPEIDARGFHDNIFDGFPDYGGGWGRGKRNPFGISSRGFHDDIFSRDFGKFQTFKRVNRPEDESTSGTRQKRSTEISSYSGNVPVGSDAKTIGLSQIKRSKLASDIFTHGFGEFDTMKKRRPGNDFHGDAFTQGFGDFDTMKRRPGGDFHDDAFTQGFGDFDTMRKRRPGADFHGDAFTQGFGDFDTMRKRRPGSDFYGDAFTQGFGDFDTMRKRRPGNEFHGDAFTQGFGDFNTMRKRRPGNEFHGDAFTQGFGDFNTMRKRRPGSDFHGDAFTHGFGDFDTMRKRRPGNDFHGDAFTQGFGDFDTMKKKSQIESKSFDNLKEIADDCTLKKHSC